MRVYIEKKLPYSDTGEVGRIRKYGQLLSEEYLEDGVRVKAYVSDNIFGRVKEFMMI